MSSDSTGPTSVGGNIEFREVEQLGPSPMPAVTVTSGPNGVGFRIDIPAAVPAPPIPPEAYTLAVFLACPHGQAVSYGAVMENHGPKVIAGIMKIAEKEGRAFATPCDTCVAVLDLVTEDGDLVGERAIHDVEQFDWWARMIELRPISADCVHCQGVPAAVMATSSWPASTARLAQIRKHR